MTSILAASPALERTSTTYTSTAQPLVGAVHDNAMALPLTTEVNPLGADRSVQGGGGEAIVWLISFEGALSPDALRARTRMKEIPADRFCATYEEPLLANVAMFDAPVEEPTSTTYERTLQPFGAVHDKTTLVPEAEPVSPVGGRHG
jgi:hypothetical protein